MFFFWPSDARGTPFGKDTYPGELRIPRIRLPGRRADIFSGLTRRMDDFLAKHGRPV